jgi:hypothetical protein
MKRRVPRLLILAAVACMAPEVPSVVTGDWGGQHVSMAATETGASLEFDCAVGTIGEAIQPDEDGDFSVTGVQFPGHGGPIKVGETIESHPARYEGNVRGDELTLTITLTDSDTEVGSFTLVADNPATITKCY